MSSSLNKVSLIGRLGAEPEIKFLPDGTAVCNFTMATDESYKDKEGNWKSNTEWHRIVVWRKLAEVCAEYLTKGKQIYIEGKLQTREWKDKEGNKRYTTEIVAREMKMLGNKDDKPQGGGQPAADAEDIPF